MCAFAVAVCAHVCYGLYAPVNGKCGGSNKSWEDGQNIRSLTKCHESDKRQDWDKMSGFRKNVWSRTKCQESEKYQEWKITILWTKSMSSLKSFEGFFVLFNPIHMNMHRESEQVVFDQLVHSTNIGQRFSLLHPSI